jgi:hypothetical protein
MAEFALHCPTQDELVDAQEGIAQILELGATGELDLPPYLVRLLVQLEDIVGAATPRPNRATPAKALAAIARSPSVPV